MNSNKPIVPKPIAPMVATSTPNGQPLFSPPRQGTSDHIKLDWEVGSSDQELLQRFLIKDHLII